MPDYSKLAKGLSTLMRGTQETLPAAQAEANLAKFLAESKDTRRFYHGNQADIERFIPSRKGVFVSPDPEFASEFSKGATGKHGPNVMPVRVQVKNPFDYDNPEHMKAIREAAKKRYPGNKNIQYELDAIGGVDDSGGLFNNWASVEHPEVQRLIQQLGHDAYYTSENGTKNLGIYNPNRIKSDIGNKGTYDVNKGDINEAKGGEVHMQAGGALKAMQAISKAAKSAGQEAPVLANKPLTTLQDFHTSLGDRVRQRAVEMQDLIESMPHKYEPGQRVFTEHSAAKNKPPYTILSRYPFGNQPMRGDHPTLGPGMGKVLKDPETGETMRTPYEPGYKVRYEEGDEWREFHIPESGIKGSVSEAKGGAIKMQAGGLSALAKLGKAGTTLSKAEIAALRARGMGVPGVDFADPLKMPNMRMSEALGNVGAEGKFLNFTEADRSRVFGNNMGGTGFSALQHYSEPHKQAGTVWGFGNKSTAEKKIRQNDPDNTIWTTYAGSPEQHKSNTVVVKDAIKNLQDANAKGTVHPEQVRLINERIRQATSDKGAPLFPADFDITDPQALSLATTFDRRTAISDALMGTGVKKPMISKEFKAANPGVQWNDASDISRILTRETDPVLANANTFDVGPHFFTMENNIIHRPDLNEAFPVQVTGTDLGLRYKPAPFRNAAPDFIREKGYGPNDPINAWALSRGNPRQFVDEKYLTGLQKEGHKDGGSVTPSFTQRLQSAIETHMAEGGGVDDNTTPDMTDGGQINYGGQYAKGGKINMPVRSLREVKPRRYAEAGYVDPLGAPDYQSSPKDARMVELAGRMIRDQAAKEGAVLSTPEGRRDIAMRVAATLPGLGMGGDLVDLVDWVQSLIPGLNKPASVLDTKGEGDKVAKYPLRSVINPPSSEQFREKFKEIGILGENQAPATEFIGNILAPGAILKAPKAVRGVEGGLNSVTAAARRPFTPATVTTEAVAPDLAKFKPREFQDYATKQMIGEGAAVPMTTMGGRKTTQRPGQGVYLNEAGQLELNPMVGIDVLRAGNLSTNRALRGDIATAGQELNQEAMAAHRFVPMATNNIKDASSMMITGPGGRALTNEEVIELGKRLPGMIVSHSPRSGGLFVAPYSIEKGKIPTEFLDAQSAANAVLGKGAKVQFGKSDPNKDLMYMMRQDYGTEGGRGTSAGAQEVRGKLKRMDKSIPAAR